MRSSVLRITVAGAAFLTGVLIGSINRYVQHERCLDQSGNTAQLAAPSPQFPVNESYPEKLGIGPFEIASFIDDHPQADLTRLWERLHIDDVDFNPICSRCKVNIFEYDLDSDSANEVVLQVKHQFGETYRYLVFRNPRADDSKFLGHIDVRAKYPPVDPFVLVSHGRPWLIVQSTAATGSGLGAWLDTVYEVSNRGVRPIASYLSRVNQSGYDSFPAKAFAGRPVSCEIKGERAILNVSYTVEYFGFEGADKPLFSKTQKAILVGAVGSADSFLDAAHSEMSQGEFESVYNFDSLSPEEFLEYNHSELRAIALGDNAGKKQWLRDFVNTCDNGVIKRELERELGHR